jgi:hypothetical protein
VLAAAPVRAPREGNSGAGSATSEHHTGAIEPRTQRSATGFDYPDWEREQMQRLLAREAEERRRG